MRQRNRTKKEKKKKIVLGANLSTKEEIVFLISKLIGRGEGENAIGWWPQ